MALDTNNNSVFKLNYSLVIVIYERKEIINETVSNRLKFIFEYISPRYNIVLVEWKYIIDSIQLVFSAAPNTDISKFINAYKSASSRLIKKEFIDIKEQLGSEKFWSNGYLILTMGSNSEEDINKYIESHSKF